ncbi:MAG TPA: ribonuclease III [Coriobacteriia bacterium]|nr:ribonuclease III [Coriobacteriia bacterium]
MPKTPQLGADERVRIVEAATGHTFGDRDLALRSVTHPSAVESNIAESFERLEFLGDSVLGLVIAEEVYRRFPHLDEGGMTRIRISLVAGSVLSVVAKDSGLEDALLFGESEMRSGMRGRTSALEDIYEAVTAALYLDGGVEVARAWVLRTLGPHIDVDAAASPANPKSVLQELVQAAAGSVHYRIASHEGPPHERTFTAEVLVNEELAGTGSGRSKREAEAAAAEAALAALEKGAK